MSSVRRWCGGLAAFTALAAVLRYGPFGANSSEESVSSSSEDRQHDLSPSWLRGRRLSHSSFYHMHVPQTPGGALCTDVLRLSQPGSGMYSWEACYVDFKQDYAFDLDNNKDHPDGIVTMVREPRHHVYLQYLHCSKKDEDDHGHRRLGKDRARQLHGHLNFSEASYHDWLTHFSGEVFQTDDNDCYHPYNMQTRVFTCNHPQDPHHDNGDHSAHNVTQAIAHMEETFFVGITEYYQESLCVFQHKFGMALKSWCKCEDPVAWASYNLSPPLEDNYTAIETSTLTDEELAMVDALTLNDRLLYQASVDRFRADVKEAEEANGFKILCE